VTTIPEGTIPDFDSMTDRELLLFNAKTIYAISIFIEQAQSMVMGMTGAKGIGGALARQAIPPAVLAAMNGNG
jgi:hypothetical protein